MIVTETATLELALKLEVGCAEPLEISRQSSVS